LRREQIVPKALVIEGKTDLAVGRRCRAEELLGVHDGSGHAFLEKADVELIASQKLG
jgi:hypothetical protein